MLGQNVDVRIRTQTLFLQHLKNEVKRFYVKSVIHSKRSGLDIFGSSWQIRIKESWTYLFCLFSRDYRHTHWIKKKRLIQQIRSKALRNLHACTHTHTLLKICHIETGIIFGKTIVTIQGECRQNLCLLIFVFYGRCFFLFFCTLSKWYYCQTKYLCALFTKWNIFVMCGTNWVQTVK